LMCRAFRTFFISDAEIVPELSASNNLKHSLSSAFCFSLI